MSFLDSLKNLFGGATQDVQEHVEQVKNNLNVDEAQQKAEEASQKVGEQASQTAQQVGEKVNEAKDKITNR